MLINTHTKSLAFWKRRPRPEPPQDPVETTVGAIGTKTFDADPGVDRLVELAKTNPKAANEVVTRLLEATSRGEEFGKLSNLVHRAGFTEALHELLEPRAGELAAAGSGSSAYSRAQYLRRLAQVLPEAMDARVFREEVVPLLDQEGGDQVLNILSTGGAFGAGPGFRDEAGRWALSQPFSSRTGLLLDSLSRDGWRPAGGQVDRVARSLEQALDADDPEDLHLLLGLCAVWKKDQPELLSGRGLEEKLVSYAFETAPLDQLQLRDLSPSASGLVARIYAVAFPNQELEDKLLERVEADYRGDLSTLSQPARKAAAALLSRTRTNSTRRLVELMRPELERFHTDYDALRLAGGVMREWLFFERERLLQRENPQDRADAAVSGVTTLLRCEEAARERSNLDLSASVHYTFLSPLEKGTPPPPLPDGRDTPDQLARLVVCERLAEGEDRDRLLDRFRAHYLEVRPTPGALPAFDRLRAQLIRETPQPDLEKLRLHESWMEQSPSLEREAGRVHREQRADWLERELPFVARAREALEDDSAVFGLATRALAADPEASKPVVWDRLERVVELSRGRTAEQMGRTYERLVDHLESGLPEDAAMVYALQETLLNEAAPAEPPLRVTLTEEELWIGGTSLVLDS